MDNIETKANRPPVRVGIVGLGRAAFFNHLPELKRLTGLFTVTAVCDLAKDRRDRVEAEFPNVHLYRRVEDMLDDPDVDLVDIASRSADHVKHALASLKRNRWTLVESPFALTLDDALVLRAADVKARGKLLVRHVGAFAPDFQLARKMLDDPRLGELYDIRVRQQLYIRRDDWQSVKRCGGGAAYYAAPDLVLQALALLRSPATQLWSELKRVASLGDAEDFAHIVLKTRGQATADIEYSGAELAPVEPAFSLRGERGVFTVAPGASSGTLHVIDPAQKFPRRRSSVRTPPISDMLEKLNVVDIPVALDAKTETGTDAFWKAVYATVRTAAPFPVTLDDAIEAIRLIQLVKKSSPFIYK